MEFFAFLTVIWQHLQYSNFHFPYSYR